MPSRSIARTSSGPTPCRAATASRAAATDSPWSWARTTSAKMSLRRSSGGGPPTATPSERLGLLQRPGGRLADRAPPLGLLAAARLARLLVVLVGPDLPLHPAALQELLEPPQGGPDRLPVVNPHPQTHAAPLEGPAAGVAAEPSVYDRRADCRVER